MSESIDTATEAPEAPEVENESENEAEPQEGSGDVEDWRSNFDAEKAGARIRKLQNEAKNLRDRAKTAEEKAAGAEQKDTRIGELEAENLKYKVGYKIGLPSELVDRLKGKTEDELVADAEALLKLVGGAKPTSGRPVEALRGGGKPDAQPEETDVDKIGSRMFRN